MKQMETDRVHATATALNAMRDIYYTLNAKSAKAEGESDTKGLREIMLSLAQRLGAEVM